jgi:glycosyltransferase involved in cell wall biosynthesis
MFHELYYPLLPNWKALVLNICHKIMLFITLNSSQIHFFSTNKFLNLSKKFSLFSSKKIHLPVGSSISIGIPKTKKNTQKNQYIIFGASHPSKKYNLIFDTFEKAFGENINFALIIIGTTIKDLEKEYKLPLNFKRYARVENKLDDSEVIAYFNKSNYLISYFSDGLTTRRSSVISALANDLPVISTLSKETDHILREEDSITLFSCDEEQYKKSLFSFIKNPNVIPYNSASKFYERELSWGHVVEKIEKAWS